MKETLKTMAMVFIAGIVFLCLVGCVVSSVDTDTVPQETVETVLTTPVETTEATEPTVDNPVNDVDNSVEATEPTATEPEVAEPEYTEEELEILAIIIYQEAGGNGSSDDTRRKVGSVFLNRVNSSRFPNTFMEVALQRAQYGSLYWTGLKWPDRAVNKGEANAVQRAYRIAEDLLIGGSILPSNVLFQAEFPQGDGVYCYQDGTYFCYKGAIE